MAKRFGRNQRRALRTANAQARNELIEASASMMMERHRWRRREEDLMQQVADARRSRDVIRVTVDAMFDDREGDMRVMGAFEMRHRETLFSAMSLYRRDIDRRSDAERAAFIKHAGEIIAEHALQQVLRHWRSR